MEPTWLRRLSAALSRSSLASRFRVKSPISCFRVLSRFRSSFRRPLSKVRGALCQAPSLAAGKAVAAVDRLLPGREKWHIGRDPTLGADHLVHLARSPSLALSGVPAVRAARRVVLKPLGSVELLLPHRKDETGPAVLACQGAVVKRHD